MKSTRSRILSLFRFLAFSSIALACRAQTLTVLVNFNGTNGTSPNSIIQGTDGNFYGTTFIGGAIGPGTVFKMTPSGTLTTLHSFSGPDGGGPGGPLSAGALLQGADGNLYGSTFGGGPGLAGTVFKVSTAGAFSMLYSLQNAGLSMPSGSMAQRTDGTLYGTTFGGCGDVFALSLSGDFTDLHDFCSDDGNQDGSEPMGGVILGKDGNLYGTTQGGGLASGEGEVFGITPEGALSILYSFTGPALGDGAWPTVLIQGADGNFYGGTTFGGPSSPSCPTTSISSGCATLFRLTPLGVLTTVHVFTDGSGADALIQGNDGNIYGTTGTGGTGTACSKGCGTVFRLTLGGEFTTLYSFDDTSVSAPTGIVLGKDGALYGTALGQSAVAGVNGVIFRLTQGSSSSEPSITANGVVSASDYGKLPDTAPGSQIEIYGSNLAGDTRGWTGGDFTNGIAPTSLDGTSVTIGGKPAFIDYISPSQVNVVVPSDVPTGLQQLTVTTAAGTSSTSEITVNALEPGLLAPAAFKIGGTQYVAAFFPDNSAALPAGAIAGLPSHPAKPGDIVTLYGIGFGLVIPNIPAGQIVQASNKLASSFEISIGGMAATVQYAGLAPNYTGLYQINVVVPNVSGNAALTFSLAGKAGTQTLYLAVEN